MIESLLPRAMYQVRLEDGRRVRAGLTSPSRHAVVRLLEGDGVLVKLVAHDPTRGQITKKT